MCVGPPRNLVRWERRRELVIEAADAINWRLQTIDSDRAAAVNGGLQLVPVTGSLCPDV
jgi:hypothetical protein